MDINKYYAEAILSGRVSQVGDEEALSENMSFDAPPTCNFAFYLYLSICIVAISGFLFFVAH